MTAFSNQIRSTKTYLWYISDVLGTGATSTVYKGRHKKTGDLVAAKAFNSMSFMRPQSVQQREFDVLLKLNHENIVKLYDIEQDQITKNPVIIMELCAGGSLFNILEDPRNSYGLEEEEFKRVLVDVCAGMKHLRDLDIVHRDIKPGNIMKVTADDGSSVYKLADFGAARELQDDENFMSLYGTEEYLHPDLYERAVLRQPSHKAFSARIDLWSIGITFYHVATGVLPFRPFGGRKNRETMYKITTRKASGVISGVQRDSMTGPIDWSHELPTTCRLSSGLKTIITSILRGLLECNSEKMWTFNRFFNDVQALFKMKVMDVFHASKSQTLKIYIEPSKTLAEFQEQIAEQTDIQATSQILLFERERFYPDASKKCEVYPETTILNPVILLEKGKDNFSQLVKPFNQTKLPKMSSTYDLDKDAAIAKMWLAVLYFTMSWLQNIICMQELMTTVSKATVSVLKAETKQLDYHGVKLKAQIVEADNKLCCIQQSLPPPSVASVVFMRTPHASRLNGKLQWAEQEITKTRRKAVAMADSFGSSELWLATMMKVIVEEDQLTQEWAPSEEKFKPCRICLKQFEVSIAESYKIYNKFKKDKQNKQLSYNEEQIHKMDKEKFNIKSTQAMSRCQSHCEVSWNDLHKNLSSWFKLCHQYRTQIDSIDKVLSDLVPTYQTLLHEVHVLEEDVRSVVTEFTEILQDTLMNTRPVTPPRRTSNAATNTDPVIDEGQDKPKVPDDLGLSKDDITSLSEQIAHLPVDSTGYVLIPPEVKAMFESWEKNVDMINNQMQLGQQQLETVKQLSFSVSHEGASDTLNHLPITSGYQYRGDT